MHYNRRVVDDQLEVTKKIHCNPFARTPLPPNFLSGTNSVESRPKYRLLEPTGQFDGPGGSTE